MARQAGKDGLQKKFSHVWVMVLRLRQICASVLLIFESCIDLLEREDFEKLNAITANEDDMSDEGAALLLHLRSVLRESHLAKSIDAGTGAAVLTEAEGIPLGAGDFDQAGSAETGGKHGTSYRIRKYLDAFKDTEKWQDVVDRARCCGCRQPPEDPMVLSCSHIYCHNCLKDLQSLAARRGHSAGQCAECGERWTSARSCQQGFEALQARPTSASSSDAPEQPKKSKKLPDGVDWLHMKGEILPSAKTMALKAQILEWIAEDTECKIIVSGIIIELQEVVLIQAGIYPMAADDQDSLEDMRNRALGLLHI
jgi:hypothetical protein